MAVPGIPANFSARPGPHLHSIYVNADVVAATPTVDNYNVYIDYITGVAKGQFRRKTISLVPDIMIDGLPAVPVYFVTIVAENSEDEGAEATEVEVRPSQ